MFAMEASIMLALQSARIPFVTQLFALISSFANKAFIWLVFALVVIIFSKGKRIQGLYIIVGVIICVVVGKLLLSNIIARPRPYTQIIGLTCWYGTDHNGYSCPSFHAMVSCCCAFIIYRFYGHRLGLIAGVLAILVCFSRCFLGVHYPTDVLLGMVLGVIAGFATIALCPMLFKKIKFPQAQRKSVSRKKVSDDTSYRKHK